MKTKISRQAFAGFISTFSVITASVAPNSLHIPVSVRPWVFLFSIAWTLLVVSGVFSS